ncbi:MAG: GNAT family N-acetyltransferase [Cytophagales bacterium]|nr:GNAT family N-acetyltransferase [Cytophagales bacterium]
MKNNCETVLSFEKGKVQDVEELEKLYDGLNEFLERGQNYPGWIKGIYPTRHQAEDGIRKNTLYVARSEGQILASVILNNEPEEAYHAAQWSFLSDYTDVFVVHTLVVRPDCFGRGMGASLMQFVVAEASRLKMKAIRLDVYKGNLPAIRLYERFGFEYVDTVDLGLGMYGLDEFKLYEKLLNTDG